MVPADGEVTSQSAIGGNACHGPAAFITTHWSVVLEAQGESPAAQEALEKLCRIYWRPVYSFLRRQGVGQEEAEDLTQGFFALLLERGDFSAVRREKGRLRSYLLAALKHFLADERRRAMAIKRGKGERLIPLEELRADEWMDMEPADPLTAERIYERRWAATVLDHALNEPGAPSRAEIAARFGMTENAIAQAFHRFRQRYQKLLRQEIAHTVATPGDVDDELRQLITVLRA